MATKACTKETTPWETLPWGRIAQLYEHVGDDFGDWTLEQPVWCSYRPPGYRVYKDKKIQAAWLSCRLDQQPGCDCGKPHNIVDSDSDSDSDSEQYQILYCMALFCMLNLRTYLYAKFKNVTTAALVFSNVRVRVKANVRVRVQFQF